MIINSINNQYNNNLFACNGIKIQCGNISKSLECIMNYNIKLLNNIINDCEITNLNNIISLLCIGQCETSPTLIPTYLPT